MDKLFAEKIGSAWIFIKEGVERSEEIESSLIEAESGFDPPDCYNGLPVHSNFSLDPIKQSLVCLRLCFPLKITEGVMKRGQY